MSFFDKISGLFSGGDTSLKDCWQILSEPDTVEQVIRKSQEKPQLIYKHSFRCSVCLFSKSQLEQAADQIMPKADMYFVDVVGARPVSNEIARQMDVSHESPQVMIIDKGEVIFHTSHDGINTNVVLEKL